MKNIWTRNQGEYMAQDIEKLSDLPPDSFWAKWFGGLIFPVLLLGPATSMIVTRTGFISGQNGSRLDVRGMNAVLLGWSFVCVSLFLHTHYFWGNSEKMIRFHEAGKILSLTGFCICYAWLVFRVYNETFTF